MKNKEDLVMLGCVLVILIFIVGILAVSAIVAKHYGITAGLLALILPLIVAIVAMVIYLIRKTR